MAATLTWPRVLGWRLGRQLLDPVGDGSAVDVVSRLGNPPAWPDLTAELAVGLRRTGGRAGDVAQALADRRLVKVYLSNTHLMTPQDAGRYLAVRASGRMWELPSWQSYYELAPGDWPRFRDYVRRALDDGPLTRSELVAALGRSSRYRHLRELVADGNDTLLKPLSWQGDMGFGPPRDGEHTFVRLDATPGWARVPALEEAGPAVVAAYLRSYGPASEERVQDKVCIGARRKDVARWLDSLSGELTRVKVEGEELLVHADDVDDLHAARASTAVRLLAARDPWVMAAGSKDTHVVPAAHRDVVSRNANPVIAGGVVSGTWARRGDRLEVTWFADSGRVPRRALADETARLASFLDRPLELDLG